MESKQKCLLYLFLGFSTHYFNLVNWPLSVLLPQKDEYVCQNAERFIHIPKLKQAITVMQFSN